MQTSTCYASFQNSILTVGNSGIERRWDISTGAPKAISVLDKKLNREWAAEAFFDSSLRLPPLPMREKPAVKVETREDDGHGASEKHLLLEVTLEWPNVQVRWQMRIWPGLPVIYSQHFFTKKGDAPALDPEARKDLVGRGHFYAAEDRMDYFALAARHIDFQLAKFVAQSDYHDNLVREQRGRLYNKEHHRLQGQFLHLSDLVAPAGLLACKLGAPPDEQINYPGMDFFCSSMQLAICGSGMTNDDLAKGEELAAYATAIGVTGGDHDQGVQLFYELDRVRHKPKPERDFAIISNTWGGGRASVAANEQDFMNEIRIGAEIGLTHCQIDAGWQKGEFRLLNVEGEGKQRNPYRILPDFWAFHTERMPNGFEPVVKLAAEKGIRLGFWFNPNSANYPDTMDKDIAAVAEICRRYGFDTVKLDGATISDKLSEKYYLEFLRKLQEEMGNKLCLNYDITGGRSKRLGHFYGTEDVGNLFIENRYTRDTGYFTFRTLRNLWQLCKYIPSYRLQMEFENAQWRKEAYGDDPLQPANFATAFSAACVLFANMLCWMEMATLSQEDRDELGKLIKAFRPHQHAVLLGRVYPIGEEPSGRSWTGLQSVTGEGEGYIVIYRELTSRASGKYTLRNVKPGIPLKLEVIAGGQVASSVTPDEGGVITVGLEKQPAFSFIRYSQK